MPYRKQTPEQKRRRRWREAIARSSAVEKTGRDFPSFGTDVHNAFVENV